MTDFTPKIILFDVDDTLLDSTGYQRYIIKTMCAQAGVECPDRFVEIFNDLNLRFWHGIEDGSITREQLHKYRFRTFFKETGITGADPDAFEKGFHKGIIEHAEKTDGADEALSYLSKKYTLYVASNASLSQQSARLRKAGLDRYFTKIFASEEIGADKPSKAFFDSVFAELGGVKPCETLFVGDSPTADITGGNAYGLKTCWLNRGTYPGQKIECDYEIHSLKDLIGLF